MDWTIDRLAELRSEYDAGHDQLLELDRQAARVRTQLLRIEGAVRVLEEQLAAAPAFAGAQPPDLVPMRHESA